MRNYNCTFVSTDLSLVFPLAIRYSLFKFIRIYVNGSNDYTFFSMHFAYTIHHIYQSIWFHVWKIFQIFIFTIQFREKEIISAIDLNFSSTSHIEYRTRIHWTEFRYIHIHIIIFIQKLPIDLSRFNGKTVHKSTFYRNYMYTCTGETMFVDLFWLLFDTLKLFALLFPTLATNFPVCLETSRMSGKRSITDCSTSRTVHSWCDTELECVWKQTSKRYS